MKTTQLFFALVLGSFAISSAQANEVSVVTCDFYSGHINVRYRFDIDFTTYAFYATPQPQDPESKATRYQVIQWHKSQNRVVNGDTTVVTADYYIKAIGNNDSGDFLTFEVSLGNKPSAKVVDSEADNAYVYGSAVSTTCTVETSNKQ